MWPFLLIFVSVEAEFFMEYTKKFIDVTVSPCANFYQHVCPENQYKHFFLKEKQREIGEMIEKYESAELKEFMKEFEERVRMTKNVSNKEEYEKNLVFYVCSKNDENSLEFLKTLVPLGKKEDNCENRMKEIATEVVDRDTQYLKFNEFDGRLKKIGNAIAFNRFINDPKNRFDEIALRLQEVVKSVQFILQKTVLNTPWVTKMKLELYLENLVKSITLNNFHFNDLHERTLSKVLDAFPKCVERIGKLSGGHSAELGFCLRFAVDSAMKMSEIEKKRTEYEQKALWEQDITISYAFYDTKENSITVFPILLLSHPEMDPYSFMGNLGFIVSHEISHSIFNHFLIDSKILPQNSMEKHSEFMNKFCYKLGLENCGSADLTRYEDGADWVGIRLAKLVADLVDEPVIGSELSRDQLFFYALTATFCSSHSERRHHDGHHTPLVHRFNALFKAMPDFTKTFKCKKEDTMYYRKNHQFLMGVHAKET